MPTDVQIRIDPYKYLPEWARPQNESVLDPWYRAPLRKVIELTGLADPQSQLLMLMNPLEAGSAQSLPAEAIQALSKRMPKTTQALKDAAETITKARTPKTAWSTTMHRAILQDGGYSVHPETGDSQR